jgi:integrase/recombinase XerD
MAPSSRREGRPSTIHSHYRILRAFANFCPAEGLLSEHPLHNVRPPRVPRDPIQPLEAEQLPALLNAARGGRDPERDHALLVLLVDSGLRVSELCSLRVGDVDRGNGQLTVVPRSRGISSINLTSRNQVSRRPIYFLNA